MSRTVSARISKETHDKLLERCNIGGCTINDWLCACIDYLLTGSSDFDFGDEEESDDDSEDDEPSDIEPEPITRKRPELDEAKFKSHYDSYGNYWTYNKDRQMWNCHIDVNRAKIMR